MFQVTDALAECFSQRPWVLPGTERLWSIHAGVAGGHVREVLDFFRLLLTQGLKGNPHLFKAVLTGILRVAKESIFSGLNNLAVYTLLRPDFATGFGFTEPEVVALLDRAGRRDQLDAVRAWYNGYGFGGEVIYNPWSILNYVDSPEPEPRPFWISTSANELVRESLVRPWRRPTTTSRPCSKGEACCAGSTRTWCSPTSMPAPIRSSDCSRSRGT